MTFEESIRQIVREEVRAAVREFASALQARPAGNPDEMLTKAEAAAAAGASISTLNRWIGEGALAVHQKGKHIRIRRGDVDALLTRHVVQGGEVNADELAERVLAARRAQ